MVSMKLSSGNFVSALLTEFPELQPLLDKHVRANDEVLPHVFFGELTRFALNEAKSPTSDALCRLLSFLESAMTSGDENVQNVIAASFLENLGPPTDEFYVIRTMSGPNLRIGLAHCWKEEPIQ
jgi:hypothetical protein